MPHHPTTRRRFLASALGTAGAAAGGLAASGAQRNAPRRGLRPPGALPEHDFLAACIRCGQCAEACPNDTIRPAGVELGLRGLGAPVIHPRRKPCVLCMSCNHACPTGALRPIERTEAGLRSVKMGTAVIDRDVCYSYNQYVCGVCYRACPLADVALKVDTWERPSIDPDACVGCGACERACIHIPSAIETRAQ